MIAKGIIVGFRADLTPFVTGGSAMGPYGRSGATDLPATMEQISAHDHTSCVLATGVQYLYVDAHVCRDQEVYDHLAFVREGRTVREAWPAPSRRERFRTREGDDGRGTQGDGRQAFVNTILVR